MTQLTKLQKQIVAETQSWIGTPYHHAARVKGAGVDCAQLLIAVYSAVGALPADFEVAEYPMDWHLHRNEERYLNQVLAHAHPVDEPRVGDIALFRFGRTISHGAIVVEALGSFVDVVHAYRPARSVCVQNLNINAELQERFCGFYRMNGVK